MSANELRRPVDGPSLNRWSKMPKNLSLYCDFVRNDLGWFTTQGTQFTETHKNQSRTWEVVDSAWFEKVFSLISKSIDSPKSPQRLMAVLDLFRRALADYVTFGSGCIPECVSRDFTQSCVEVESRAGNIGSSLTGVSTPFDESTAEEDNVTVRKLETGKKIANWQEIYQNIGFRSIESFSGVHSGDWEITSVYSDAYGMPLANVSSGSVEVSGVSLRG